MRRTAQLHSVRWGYTLIELTIGILASSMLLAGLTAAVGITAKAISPSGSGHATLQAAKSTGLIADELQSAIHVRNIEPDALNFVVDGRTNGHEFEDIAYDWTDSSVELNRRFNNRSGVLLEDVKSFSLTPKFREIKEELGGRVFESDDVTLTELTSSSGWYVWYLSPWQRIGQSVELTHPDNTVSWNATKIDVLVRRDWYYYSGEDIIVQLCEATGDGLPTTNVLAEGTIPISSLSTWSWRWKSVTLNVASQILPTQNVCVVLSGDTSIGGYAGQVAYATSGFTHGGSLLKEYYGNWYHDYDDALYYRITGVRGLIDETSHEVTRQYFVGCNVELEHNEGSPLRRNVRLLNTPEHLDGLWTLNFNVDPAGSDVDTDFDGSADWAFTGTGSYSASVDSSRLELLAGQTFQTTIDNDFAGLITAEVHCRGTSHNSSGGGAKLAIPFGFDASSQGLVTIRVDSAADGSQAVEVVAAADGGSEISLADVSGLPNDLVAVRVVIDPSADVAAVWVNDQAQGRSDLSRPLTGGEKRAEFGAEGASAEFDFLSIRVGATE